MRVATKKKQKIAPVATGVALTCNPAAESLQALKDLRKNYFLNYTKDSL